MSNGRIEKEQLISNEALQAPLELAKNLEQIVKQLEKIMEVARKGKGAISGATSVTVIQNEVEKLAKAQGSLNEVQQKIATEGRQRSREEIASLEAIIKKRQTLQEKIKSLNKDQKEDLDLLKKNVISRSEYTNRLVQSNTAIKQAQVAISGLNKLAKDQILITKTVGNEYQKLSISLDQATLKYKNLAASGTATQQQLLAQQKIVEQLRNKIDVIDKAAGNFQRNVGNYPGTLGAATVALKDFLGAFGLVGGMVLFARMLKEVIGQMVEFEFRNSELKAVLGGTQTELRELRHEQLALGKATQYTSTQVAEMQIEFAKLGFPTEDIKAMTKTTLNAALALGSGLGEQAALTGAALKSFKLPASEAGRVNDVLAKGAAASALSFDKLATAMPYVGSVAKAFGFTLEDTVALLGELTNAGFDGSSSATALRKIFLLLADTNGKLAKSLDEPVKDLPSLIRGFKQLQAEGTDLAEALELTDVRSVAAFKTFLEGTESLEKLSVTLNNAKGAADQMAEAMGDNLRGDFLKVKSAWEAFVVSILDGDSALSKFLRAVSQMTAGILNMLTPVDKLSKGLQREQIQLNSLVDTITKGNLTTEVRVKLLQQLNTDYPKFLENLNAETVTNEQLAERLKDVNAQFVRRIALAAAEERLKKTQEDILNTIDNEIALRERIAELQRGETQLMEEDRKAAIALAEGRINEELKKREKLQLVVAARLDFYSRALGIFNDENKNYFEEEKKGAEIIKTKIKLSKEELDALNKLREFRLELAAKNEGDELKKIDREVDLELFRRKILLDNEELLQSERQLIIEKSDAVIQELQDKRAGIMADRRYKLLKENGEKEVRAVEERLERETQLIQEAAIRGEISQDEAERRIAKLKRSLADDSIKAQIDSITKILDLESLSAEERKKYEIELYKLKVALTDAYYKQLEDKEKTSLEKTAEFVGKVKQIYDEFSSAIVDLSDSIAARRIENINAELAAVQDREKKELEAAGDNEMAKKEIQARADADRERLEKKRLAEQRRAAVLAKTAALIEAAIRTSLAILLQLSEGDPYTAIPRSILAGSLGAIQIAAIAAKPIPQYADGTPVSGHQGGLAIIGEEGSELMRSPSGQWSLSPSEATMVEMKKGTHVYPRKETLKMLSAAALNRIDSVTTDYKIREGFEELRKEVKRGNQSLEKAVRDSAPGNLYQQGIVTMEGKKKMDGSMELIRRSALGKSK